MKKEDLFEGFGMLDDKLIQRSEKGGFPVNMVLKWGGLAACLAVAASVCLFAFGSNHKRPDSVPEGKAALEESHSFSEEQNIIADPDPEIYVDTTMLLASDTGTGIKQQALAIARVEIDQYVALYSKADSVECVIKSVPADI